MVKDIVVSGKVIGKKYGIVLNIDKTSSDKIEPNTLSINYVDNMYQMWW